MLQYKNPVIKGFNPDPSICRVGEDFYLVTSTFEFFPGVPVYHSKNLVDWTLINYCLDRKSQLDLNNCNNSAGIYAPTIRHHNGTFYMVTTNVRGGGHFYVHTKDITEPWSEPIWVDQDGIDPTLFFDDDGKVYFCSTCFENQKQGIGFFEIDIKTGKRLEPKRIISMGSGGRHPEAPHIYKIGGFYYLMIAEGGTEYGHMVTIQRSTDIYGPYENCPHNPILSHRDFSESPIQATGHADIVEDQHGNWWMVCLGIRPKGGLLHQLGRETFLSPVQWNSDHWPVIGDSGRISLDMSGELPAALSPQDENPGCHFLDDFSGNKMKLDWNYIRNPDPGKYSLTDSPGKLTLYPGNESLSDFAPTWAGIRQQEFDLVAETKLVHKPAGNSTQAGISAFYNKEYYYASYVTKENNKAYVVLEKRIHDYSSISDRHEIDYTGEILFRIKTSREWYEFFYNLNGKWKKLGQGAAAGLCTEGTMSMTFTGVYLGIFASSEKTGFDYFSICDA